MSKERLRILFCDHLNIARGKYMPYRAQSGATRFCSGTLKMSYENKFIPSAEATVIEGMPDIEAVYEAADIRESWHSRLNPNAGFKEFVVVCDLKDNQGASLSLCGRTALKCAIADWETLGYKPMVGVELEAFAFQIEADGSLKPYDAPFSHFYATGTFAESRGFIDAIWEAASHAGFRINSIHTECDSPQFEFTLTYDHALKAIDDIFLFKLLAREVAFKHGILLTFMPKPILSSGSSGVHINFSLQDVKGNNAISGGLNESAINPLTRACTAGLMHHHAALAGLCAPTVNSYDRLKPASLSAFWQNWGIDHRGVAVRLSAESGVAARIEHRLSDGAANPYTVTAAVLQAARLGVVKQYELQPQEIGDCIANTNAQFKAPSCLNDALNNLAADTDLVKAVSAGLVTRHIDIKRHEIQRLAEITSNSNEEFAGRNFYIWHI